MDKKFKRAEKNYKKMTGCNVRQAHIAIWHRMLLESIHKSKKICPTCGGELYWESGGYEEGYGDFIACYDCDFTAGTHEYTELSDWYDFDYLVEIGKVFREYGYSFKTWKQTIKKITADRKAYMVEYGKLYNSQYNNQASEPESKVKYKLQYGIENDVVIEGKTFDEVFKNAESELDKRGWRKDYQGMKLDKSMLVKIE